MSQHSSSPGSDGTSSGKSVMEELIRNKDWLETPLGPRPQWPQSLRVALDIILHSAYPMFIWWGPELLMFHNDAYLPVLGNKHPHALGKSARAVWSEIWPDVGQVVDDVFQGKEFFARDLLLYLERKGFPEETYWTFSYSPFLNDEGVVGGLFCACNEETQKILRQRRLNSINQLSALSVRFKELDPIGKATMAVLKANPRDIPFSALYLMDEETAKLKKIAESCADDTEKVFPQELELSAASPTQIWDLRALKQTVKLQIRRDLEEWLPRSSHMEKSPTSAAIIPILKPGHQELEGVLICGISPYLEFDQEYQSFLELTAGQIAAAIAEVRTLASERQRINMLEEIDRAKTVFFSNVSHEFRTPLTLLLNPVKDVLFQYPEATTLQIARSKLEMVYRNGLRLQKLVNNLLDFSSLESDRVQATFLATDIVRFTVALSSNFEAVMQEAGLRLIMNTREIEAPVYVDRDMWEKVVLNLLSNAFKHTFEGYIEVSVYPRDQEVVLQVRDTGIGIPQKDLPHIFDRFHRVPDARSRTHEGSGIGLSLVKEMVRLHHGWIEVSSREQEGTVFTVHIPQGKAHLPADRVLASDAPYADEGSFSEFAKEIEPFSDHSRFRNVAEAPEQGAADARLQPEKDRHVVLLADDNPDMRAYLKDLLAVHFQVVAVENGRQALDYLAENHPPDLILSDIMMPELDGIALLQKLKSNPHTHQIPFVLLSARAGEESRLKGLKYGVDDYLVKPFSARELVARIEARIEIAMLRKRAELEEKARREQLTSIFRQAPAGITLLDGPELRFSLANSLFQMLSGRSEEALIGRTMEEAFPELIGSEVLELIHRTYHSGEAFVAYEYPVGLQLPDSPEPQQAYFRFIAQPMTDAEGGVEGVMVLAVEVTDQVRSKRALENELKERKRIEAALMESEQKFRKMADNVPVMIWLTAADANCIYLNRQWYDYSGQTEAEALGFGWLSVVHPEDAPEAERIFLQANEQQTPFSFNYRLRDKHGKYRWHLDSGLPKFDEEGEFQGFIGAVVDVHERKLAENQLLEKEEKLRLAIESTNLGTWDYYPLSGVLQWSHICKQTFGVPVEEDMSYEKFLHLLHPDDRERTDIMVQKALEGKHDYDIEYRALRQNDREERWIKATGEVYFNEGGQAYRFIGTVQDVTERKLAEQQKDDFLRMAGHELRTPLTSIIGYLGLMKRLSQNDKEVTDYLEKSLESTVKMRNLVSDFLDISKVERGELAFDMKRINFSELVTGMIENLQLVFPRHPFQLEVNDNIFVVADSDRMEQVVANLVNNAAKYSRTQQPVQVTLHAESGMALLSIRDQGIGMEKEEIDRIFSKFYRIASSSKIKGMGLGLYIVKKIVDFHGGAIEVGSIPKKGTVFTVKFPLASA